MTRPTLDSTPLGTNMTNETTSPIESIPVEKKMPEATLLTQPTEYPEQYGEAHVPEDPDPFSSDSSLKEKKFDKKKKCRKHKKYDSSDPSSNDDSDSFYNSDRRRKRRKRKRDRKKYLIP